MNEIFSRTEILLGKETVERLSRKHVLLLGVGGVGAAAAEALVRGGIGAITIVDGDRVAASNLNRQIVALTSNVGDWKTEAMCRRLKDINPSCTVRAEALFYGPETADRFPLEEYDYAADAIDMVSAKLLLLERCRAAGTPVITSMGTGGKIHPEMLRLGTLEETEGCPLARVMRRECRKRGISGVKCVWSPEEPLKKAEAGGPIGTVSFVPPIAGYLMAGEILRSLIRAGD